uniref:Uncharacterized protein n=1 Tax=Neolamprologus brichardi TaxID=32507 RepID=A0A3Q4GF74_NEOBR
ILLIHNFFTEPVICYFLDGFLIIYCIIVTGFFFREKVSYTSLHVCALLIGLYNFVLLLLFVFIYVQELERPKDADPYEVLFLVRRTEGAISVMARDPLESLIPSTSSPRPVPPLSPH